MASLAGRKVVRKDLDLLGDGNITAIGTGTDKHPPWQSTLDTGGNSTATYLSGVAGIQGGAQLAMDATNEVQEAQLHFGDNLSLDIDDLHAFGFNFRFTVLPGSSSVAVVGLAGASEPADSADEDTIAQNLWMKIEGASSTTALVAESDDGTTDNNDVATGLVVAANEWKRVVFAFKESVSGKSDVRIYCSGTPGPGGDDRLIRVASGTTFDMDQYAGGLQPYFCILKASSTNTGTLQIANVWYKAETLMS